MNLQSLRLIWDPLAKYFQSSVRPQGLVRQCKQLLNPVGGTYSPPFGRALNRLAPSDAEIIALQKS